MNDDKDSKDPLDALKLPKGSEGLRDTLKTGRDQIKQYDTRIGEAQRKEVPKPALTPGPELPYAGPSSAFLKQQQHNLKDQYAWEAAVHMDRMDSTGRLETTRALQTELGIDPAQTRAAHHEYQTQKLDQVQAKFSDMRDQSRQMPPKQDVKPVSNEKGAVQPDAGEPSSRQQELSHPLTERYLQNKEDISTPGGGGGSAIDRDDR